MRKCWKVLALCMCSALAGAAFTFLGMGIWYSNGPGYPKVRQVEYNCSDFRAWDEAMAVFRSQPGDPYRLDGDGDGMPCEDLLGR